MTWVKKTVSDSRSLQSQLFFFQLYEDRRVCEYVVNLAFWGFEGLNFDFRLAPVFNFDHSFRKSRMVVFER